MIKRKSEYSDNRRYYCIFVVEALLSILVLLCFSVNYSPILPYREMYDTAVYDVMGHGLAGGKILYRDYFDIKGPLFFAVQILGQSICPGRTGIFLTECAAMLLTVCFIVRINRFCSHNSFCCFFIFLLYEYVYVTISWGGCTVEVYLLPFLAGCLYNAIKQLDLIRRGDGISRGGMFFIGASAAVCFFSKMTMAAPIAAIMLVMCCSCLIEKKTGLLKACIISASAGFFIVVLPILIWFYFQGTLETMLKWSFYYAAVRGVQRAHDFSVADITYLLGSYLAIVSVIIKHRLKLAAREDWLLGTMAILTIIVLQLGGGYEYYYLLTLPLIVLTAVILIKDIRSYLAYDDKDAGIRSGHVRVLITGIACIFCVISVFSNTAVRKYRDIFGSLFQRGSDIDEDMKELLKRIPEQDMDGLFCMEAGGIAFFDYYGILPANFCPGFVITFDYLEDGFYEKRKAELLEARPVWILSKFLKEKEQKDMYGLITELYDNVFTSDKGFELWKIKKR